MFYTLLILCSFSARIYAKPVESTNCNTNVTGSTVCSTSQYGINFDEPVTTTQSPSDADHPFYTMTTLMSADKQTVNNVENKRKIREVVETMTTAKTLTLPGELQSSTTTLSTERMKRGAEDTVTTEKTSTTLPGEVQSSTTTVSTGRKKRGAEDTVTTEKTSTALLGEVQSSTTTVSTGRKKRGAEDTVTTEKTSTTLPGGLQSITVPITSTPMEELDLTTSLENMPYLRKKRGSEQTMTTTTTLKSTEYATDEEELVRRTQVTQSYFNGMLFN